MRFHRGDVALPTVSGMGISSGTSVAYSVAPPQAVSRPDIARHLKERTCVTFGGRQWYRLHDNAPLRDILCPKILGKDITQEPHFWADREGTLVPRHTVYYMVPKDGGDYC